jgi:hypothetical protein
MCRDTLRRGRQQREERNVWQCGRIEDRLGKRVPVCGWTSSRDYGTPHNQPMHASFPNVMYCPSRLCTRKIPWQSSFGLVQPSPLFTSAREQFMHATLNRISSHRTYALPLCILRLCSLPQPQNASSSCDFSASPRKCSQSDSGCVRSGRLKSAVPSLAVSLEGAPH